jgi:hypothetical protein
MGCISEIPLQKYKHILRKKDNWKIQFQNSEICRGVVKVQCNICKLQL